MPAQITKESQCAVKLSVGRLAGVATALLLFAVLFLQWRAARVLLGSTPQGDAAKHYTSGVLVFDYLRTGLGSRPVPFAESFEVQYPLVGIGQWPPMYYAIQGVFYLVAGPSIRSAQILSVLMSASLAAILFATLRVQVGARIAVTAAALFLAVPLIQSAAWQVMSDLLTGLFVYLSVAAFAKLLDQPGDWRHAIAFLACAIASVLSKGSAWALVPFCLLAPLLCRRIQFFASGWFVGAVLAVIMLGSVFYGLAAQQGIGYPILFSQYLSSSLGNRLFTLRQVLTFAPPALIVASVAGGALAFRARWVLGDQSSFQTLSLAALAWILAQFLFLGLLPMTREPRVLTPALAPMVVLIACFLRWIETALSKSSRFVAVAVSASIGAMIVVNCVRSPLSRVDGFQQAANVMPYPEDGALILVAANDWGGEEEIIAERLSHGVNHKDVILRGTHVLADVGEDRKDKPLLASVEEVRAYLLQMPVRFVVLGSPPYNFAFLPLIDSAVTGDPEDFHLIARVPLIVEPSGKIEGNLRIFENPAGRDRHPSTVSTRLGAYAKRRVLTYHWR